MSAPRPSRLPSPARLSVGACALLVILAVAGSSLYYHRRAAALAYLANAGSNEVHARVPDWWPESVPCPAWFGSVDVAVLSNAACDLRRLTPLSELRHLRCARCELNPDGFRRLGAFRQLELLQLEGSSVEDGDLASLRDCPQLTHLSLKSTAITDSGLKALVKLRLQQLDVSDTRITDAGLAQLGTLPLQGLRINDTSIGDAGLGHLSGLRLTTLFADRTRITGSGLGHLATMPLEELSLAGTPVSDAHLADLAGCASLRTLTLASTAITDAGVAQLAPLPLTALNLAHTRIGDDGLHALRGMPLKSLNVSGTQITADSLETLCAMKTLGSLTASDPPFRWESLQPVRTHGITVSLETTTHQ